MNGLLVRVGTDLSDGGGRWNGPVDSRTGQFAYVPIPETKQVRPGLATTYQPVRRALEAFKVQLPPHLEDANCHLDPDFEHLTYGDRGAKGRQLVSNLSRGDLIVFYAGLRDIGRQALVYGIIGLFTVDKILPIHEIEAAEYGQNAHTRREPRVEADDVIVIGDPSQSGRAERCVPIGEHRSKAYRVTEPLLQAWGGLSVKDGYLQRSAVFPSLLDTARFWRWWELQGISLIRRNN